MNDIFKHTVNVKEVIYILAIVSTFLFNYFFQVERIKLLEYRTEKLEENVRKINEYIEKNNIQIVLYKIEEIEKMFYSKKNNHE